MKTMKTSHIIDIIESSDDDGFYAEVSRLPECNQVHLTAVVPTPHEASRAAIKWTESQKDFQGFSLT